MTSELFSINHSQAQGGDEVALCQNLNAQQTGVENAVAAARPKPIRLDVNVAKLWSPVVDGIE